MLLELSKVEQRYDAVVAILRDEEATHRPGRGPHHRTLRTEFLTGRLFVDLASAQAELDAWVLDYNTERPHQSLQVATLAERFVRPAAEPPSPPLDTSALDQDRSGDDWVARTVSVNGAMSVANQVSCRSASTAVATSSMCGFVDSSSRRGTALDF